MVKQLIKRKLSWLAAAALAVPLAVPFAAYSAEVKIKFHEPEHYSDMQPARENSKKFRERTLEGLQEIFTELAETLPDDQVLHITVTDVDLAGNVDLVERDGGMYPVRLVSGGRVPSMTLEYSLQDADGSVLKENEERIRGQGVDERMRRSPYMDSAYLRHERDMLERWFERTFED